VKSEELSGNLIVIEGTDGSGRSTQIALLTEWLESQGFAVETMGLRRSALVGEDIDGLLAENSVTRMTLALMYSTDFFDQLERRLLPALRSGLIVLADRYIFTLVARAAVRGISRDYLHGIYEMALRPDLTFWLNVRPEVAFDREFRKSQTISYWESGRDMSLSNDLFQSFIRYQSMIKREFEYLSKRHGFIELDGEGSVSEVNRVLRTRIASHLGISRTQYKPSHALSHLWR
jgi:dTMP kinase